MVRGHQVHRRLDAVLLAAADHRPGRHLADGHGGVVEAFGDNPVEDVAVGHDALQIVGGPDGQRAHVQLAHHHRRLADRRVGPDKLDVTGHEIADPHAAAPAPASAASIWARSLEKSTGLGW